MNNTLKTKRGLNNIITEDYLKYNYLILKKSMFNISEDVGCDRKNIEYYIKKYKIKKL